MSLLKETGKYIFKREAYRQYTKVRKNGLSKGSINCFAVIGGIAYYTYYRSYFHQTR
jgi:hypothetical protein